MNSQVLGTRRRVFPKESQPCCVPGWYLNFNVEGVPFFEPCFASIGRKPWAGTDDPTMELQAVAHRITAEDFARIQRTEGGGGHAGLGYDPITIQVVLADGRTVNTVTLLHQTRAHGFLAHPSRRYYNLILNGAKESKMPAEYLAYLEAVPVYERPKSMFSMLCILLCLAPYFLFVAAPVLLAYAASKGMSLGGKRQAPRVIHVALHAVIDMCYVLHNTFWVHFTGSGYVTGGAVVKDEKKIM